MGAVSQNRTLADVLLREKKSIIANNSHNFSENRDVCGVNWLIVGVFGLQTDAVFVMIKGFDRGFILDQGNGDFSVVNRWRLTGNDNIPVENPGHFHAVAAHVQRKVFIAGPMRRREGDISLDVLLRQDRLTGSNSSYNRDLYGTAFSDNMDRAVQAGVPNNVALALKRFQVRMHA